MNSSLGDLTPAFAASENHEMQNLESRTDVHGITTFHLRTRDRQSGLYTEKVFDQNQKLIKIKKRNRTSQSETFYSPDNGQVTRLLEISSLPDGSTMTRDVNYSRDNRSNELVTVVAPNGEKVRKVERQHVGLRTIFQGQTEYSSNGVPATTVNHYMDMASGRLMRREQVQWLNEKQRSLSESIHFDKSGFVSRYSKIVYHASAGPFLEEQQEFYPQSNCIKKRRVSAFNMSGILTCLDVVQFSEKGELVHRETSFFDESGNPVLTRN